ncbi:unnamed protein product [Euphydryas editha]|uniref:Uncharacterized protein n=1 Tax=Euphydryas editha TaxID=104508 RepID=A0AAU9TT50_EUPED|nr:unnamed protein product [Euphydryas editha]
MERSHHKTKRKLQKQERFTKAALFLEKRSLLVFYMDKVLLLAIVPRTYPRSSSRAHVVKVARSQESQEQTQTRLALDADHTAQRSSETEGQSQNYHDIENMFKLIK